MNHWGIPDWLEGEVKGTEVGSALDSLLKN